MLRPNASASIIRLPLKPRDPPRPPDRLLPRPPPELNPPSADFPSLPLLAEPAISPPASRPGCRNSACTRLTSRALREAARRAGSPSTTSRSSSRNLRNIRCPKPPACAWPSRMPCGGVPPGHWPPLVAPSPSTPFSPTVARPTPSRARHSTSSALSPSRSQKTAPRQAGFSATKSCTQSPSTSASLWRWRTACWFPCSARPTNSGFRNWSTFTTNWSPMRAPAVSRHLHRADRLPPSQTSAHSGSSGLPPYRSLNKRWFWGSVQVALNPAGILLRNSFCPPQNPR